VHADEPGKHRVACKVEDFGPGRDRSRIRTANGLNSPARENDREALKRSGAGAVDDANVNERDQRGFRPDVRSETVAGPGGKFLRQGWP
jgi:hypothetical protein